MDKFEAGKLAGLEEAAKLIDDLASSADRQAKTWEKELGSGAESIARHFSEKRDEMIALSMRIRALASTPAPASGQEEKYRTALEDIALLDEADGHELKRDDALRAVGIASNALGKHPSEIFHARLSATGGAK